MIILPNNLVNASMSDWVKRCATIITIPPNMFDEWKRSVRIKQRRLKIEQIIEQIKIKQ